MMEIKSSQPGTNLGVDPPQPLKYLRIVQCNRITFLWFEKKRYKLERNWAEIKANCLPKESRISVVKTGKSRCLTGLLKCFGIDPLICITVSKSVSKCTSLGSKELKGPALM